MEPQIPVRANAIIRAIAANFAPDAELLGAEIGVLQGAVAASLLWTFPRLRLYLVDPYKHKPRPGYEATGDYVAFLSDQEHEVNRTIAVNVTEFAADRRIWVPEFSPEAIHKLPPLDFVFIDADHSPEGATADIEACYANLKRPGLLAGHDYHFGPVHDAVDRFAASKGLTISVGDHATWWSVLR